MRFSGRGPQPGDWMYRPSTVDELIDHWSKCDSVWVPEKSGGRVGLIVDVVVRAEHLNSLRIHGLLRGRRTIYAPWRWFAFYVGEPPAVRYPVPLLVIKRLPAEVGDKYWHPNKQLIIDEG